jgi:hypothetical protein
MKPDSIGQHNRQGSGNNVGLKVPDDVRFARLNRTYSTEITCFFGAAAAKTAATSRFIAHQAPILYNIISSTSTLLHIFSFFARKKFSRSFSPFIVYFAQKLYFFVQIELTLCNIYVILPYEVIKCRRI